MLKFFSQIGIIWAELFGKRKVLEWTNEEGEHRRIAGFVYKGIFYPYDK